MKENKPGKKIWLCSRCLDFSFSSNDNKKLCSYYMKIKTTLLLTKTLLNLVLVAVGICLCKLGKPLNSQGYSTFTDTAIAG